MSARHKGHLTKAEMDERINKKSLHMKMKPKVDYAIMLIAQNLNTPEILAKLKDRFGMCERQNHRYYKKATELLEDSFNENIKDIRNKHIMSLDKDIKEAYKNYTQSQSKSTVQVKWFDIYCSLKQERKSLFINNLKPVDEDEGVQTINITYTKVEK